MDHLLTITFSSTALPVATGLETLPGEVATAIVFQDLTKVSSPASWGQTMEKNHVSFIEEAVICESSV